MEEIATTQHHLDTLQVAECSTLVHIYNFTHDEQVDSKPKAGGVMFGDEFQCFGSISEPQSCLFDLNK